MTTPHDQTELVTRYRASAATSTEAGLVIYNKKGHKKMHVNYSVIQIFMPSHGCLGKIQLK